jgi:hypothetical protein
MSAHSTAGMGLVGAHFERPALLRQKPVRISICCRCCETIVA